MFYFSVCSKPFPSSAPGETPKQPATDEVDSELDKPIGNDVNTSENLDSANTSKEEQNNTPATVVNEKGPKSPEDEAKVENNQTSPDPNKAENKITPPETEDEDKKGKDKLHTLAPDKIDDQESHNEAGKGSEDAPKEDGAAKEQESTAEQNKDDEPKDSKPDEDGGKKSKEDGTGQEEHTDVVGEPSGEKGGKKPATADQNEEAEDNNNPELSEEDEDEEKTPVPEILTDEDDLEGEETVDEPSNEQYIFNSKTEMKDSYTKTYQPEKNAENSHFFAYLVCAVILVAVLYIASHNKRKVSGSVCACSFFQPREFV